MAQPIPTDLNEFIEYLNTTTFDVYSILCSVSNDGQLHLVKHMIDNTNVDMCKYGNCVYSQACCCGQVEVAKYLIHKFPNIDIHAYSEHAFMMACTYVHNRYNNKRRSHDIIKLYMSLDFEHYSEYIKQKNYFNVAIALNNDENPPCKFILDETNTTVIDCYEYIGLM